MFEVASMVCNFDVASNLEDGWFSLE